MAPANLLQNIRHPVLSLIQDMCREDEKGQSLNT